MRLDNKKGALKEKRLKNTGLSSSCHELVQLKTKLTVLQLFSFTQCTNWSCTDGSNRLVHHAFAARVTQAHQFLGLLRQACFFCIWKCWVNSRDVRIVVKLHDVAVCTAHQQFLGVSGSRRMRRMLARDRQCRVRPPGSRETPLWRSYSGREAIQLISWLFFKWLYIMSWTHCAYKLLSVGNWTNCCLRRELWFVTQRSRCSILTFADQNWYLFHASVYRFYYSTYSCQISSFSVKRLLRTCCFCC